MKILHYLCSVNLNIHRGNTSKKIKIMKTFEFNKATKQAVVNAIKTQLHVECDNVMALATIKRHWFKNDEVYIFKRYGDNKTHYAYYKKNNTLLEFENEKEAYEFILNI